MPVITKKSKTRRIPKAANAKIKSPPKNGPSKTKTVKQEGVYLLRPRRLSSAEMRHAKRLVALVRQEMESSEFKTLEDAMHSTRGRTGW